MHAIPVDLILHELAQRLRELPEEKHHALAKALTSYCINHRDLAGQWCNGAGVAQQAAWLVRRLDGEAHAPQIAHETRALEVAIARRLADCGLSLLITQDANDGIDAVTLLEASYRVVGLSSAEVYADDTASWESRIAALEGQLSATTEQRDAAWSAAWSVRDDAREYHNKALADLRKSLNMENGGLGNIIAAISRLRDNLDLAQELAALRLAKIADNQTCLNAIKDAMGLGREKRHDDVLTEVQRLVTSAKRSEAISAERLQRIDHLQKFRGRLHEALGVAMDGNDDEALFARLNTILGERGKAQGAGGNVAPCRAFKVGDRVVVARKAGGEQGMWSPSNDIHIGQTGEVQHVILRNDTTSHAYRVAGLHDVDGNPDDAYFLAESLDLAPPDTRTLRDRIADRGLDVTGLEADGRRKFKVGDKVKFARAVGPESDHRDTPPIGWEGVIDKDDESELPFRVVGATFKKGVHAWWCIGEALDLVTPTA